MSGESCPRCGSAVATRPGRGRPRQWCSDACRKLASEERRAAERGAVGLKLVDRVTVRTVRETVRKPPTVPEAVEVVLGNAEATRAVLSELADRQATGRWRRYDRRLWAPLILRMAKELGRS